MISINVKTMTTSAIVLKEYFESKGVSCWICVDMEGGIDYREEIVAAVKKCKIFLPLINSEWASSGECKDEYNFAKRLNLTSHESGKTVEGSPRLPVILPIAFPNLIWDQHPHVELLAASTNFIVHKFGSIDTIDTEGSIDTLNALVRSINSLDLVSIPKLGTVDEVGAEEERVDPGGVKKKVADKAKEESEIMKAQVSDMSQQLSNVLKHMQELQTALSQARQEQAPALLSQDSHPNGPGRQPSHQETGQFPISGWTAYHLKENYMGTTVEESWRGCLLTWSMEISLTKGEAAVEPLSVTGYCRWRLINAVPFRDNYDKGGMASYVAKIHDEWEADEVFTGVFNAASGTLSTSTHQLRTIAGNPCTNANEFIGSAQYSYVLMHDGSEMVGRCMYTQSDSINRNEFFNTSVIRCMAF